MQIACRRDWLSCCAGLAASEVVVKRALDSVPIGSSAEPSPITERRAAMRDREY
jgi:hypothetical protein